MKKTFARSYCEKYQGKRGINKSLGFTKNITFNTIHYSVTGDWNCWFNQHVVQLKHNGSTMCRVYNNSEL